MNTLDSYREYYIKKSIPQGVEDSVYICLEDVQREGFRDGFDTAVELNLPVLFSEWKDLHCKPNGYSFGNFWCDWDNFSVMRNTKELYEYYITHVFKPPTP